MNTKQMRESIVMAKELDVAGEFVYAALEKINKIDTYEEVSDIFFILYHLSVIKSLCICDLLYPRQI